MHPLGAQDDVQVLEGPLGSDGALGSVLVPSGSDGRLGKPSNQIFGKNWEFGPTRSTPPPPKLGRPKQKQKLMFIWHFRLF